MNAGYDVGQSREGTDRVPTFFPGRGRQKRVTQEEALLVRMDSRREEMLVQQGNGAGGWRVREGPLMQGTRQKPEAAREPAPKAKNILESGRSSGCKDLESECA